MSDDPAVDPRPRLSAIPPPPYAYVPGHTPHPVSDPRGHMYGHSPQVVAALDPADWRGSGIYLYALDLFNYGYYWEAHEAWESLWNAAGRRGPTAVWLKALIKLAAAGVKAREGNAVGVARHARRAGELLAELRRSVSPSVSHYSGLELPMVEQVARELERSADQFDRSNPGLLLEFQLTPHDP
jgi:uncharacterized protein